MAPIEYPVKGIKDFKAFRSIFEDEQFEIDTVKVAALEERIKFTGDDGVTVCSILSTPLGNLVREYMGVETLAYLYADHPTELRDILSVMEDNYLRRVRLISLLNIDGTISMDDTSTTTISPNMFRDLEMSYIDHASAIIHPAGKFYIHHSCGLIKNLLELYRQTKMDAVHAFTIPPVGDVTIAEGRKKLGDRITIMAGLSQLSENIFDRDAVASGIQTMFEEAAPGNHFVFLLGAYPDKTMEDMAFVVEECRKYQRTGNR